MGLFRPLLATEGNSRSFQSSGFRRVTAARILFFFFFKSSSNINVEKVTFLYNNATPQWDYFNFRPHKQLVPEPFFSCDD